MVLEKGYTGGSVLDIILALVYSSLSIGQASPCFGGIGSGKSAIISLIERFYDFIDGY